MKLSKELKNALEAVSKEVDSWPAWKRSIDMHELNKVREPSQKRECKHANTSDNRKTIPMTRAAGA